VFGFITNKSHDANRASQVAGEMILAGLTAPGLVKATAFKAGKSKILSAKTGLFFYTYQFVQN